MMFGVGLAVCLVIDSAFYLYSMKDIPKEYLTEDAALTN